MSHLNIKLSKSKLELFTLNIELKIYKGDMAKMLKVLPKLRTSFETSHEDSVSRF